MPMKTKPGSKQYMTKKGMIRDVNHHRMMGPLAFRGGRGYPAKHHFSGESRFLDEGSGKHYIEGGIKYWDE
tara:strand:+ start:248 stop:460 length:213 start_codon:yes stop_codon:yes gene_type:complete